MTLNLTTKKRFYNFMCLGDNRYILIPDLHIVVFVSRKTCKSKSPFDLWKWAIYS